MMIDANIYRDSPGLQPGLGRVRRGMGSTFDAGASMTCAAADAELKRMSWYEKGIWNPWYVYVKGIQTACSAVVGTAAYAQYGVVPTPKPSEKLAPIGPTDDKMTTWTPADAGVDLAAYTDEQRAAIQKAIDDGTYNPEGNFSWYNLFSLGGDSAAKRTVWDEYKWLIIGGSALGALYLLAKGGSAGVRVYRGTF